VLVVEKMDDEIETILARVFGGTMSFKATMRSMRLSSMGTSRSDESEISESREMTLVVVGKGDRL